MPLTCPGLLSEMVPRTTIRSQYFRTESVFRVSEVIQECWNVEASLVESVLEDAGVVS